MNVRFSINTETLKTILEILKYLKPKAYNAITRLIVIVGLGLISPPFITLLINWLTNQSLSFHIINENDPYFGIALIICALVYNIYASKLYISKRAVSLVLGFENNSIYLANEGSVSVELFRVLLEIYEIFEKPEFRNEEKLLLNIETLLKPEHKAPLFELTNQIKGAFDKFNKRIQPNETTLPPLPFGLTLYIHYNIVGVQKRMRVDFDRWVIKSSNGNYTVYKDSAYYERNLPLIERIKQNFIDGIKWFLHPISQYKKYRMYNYAQKKLGFESTIRALYNQKISEKEAVNRIIKLVGKTSRNKEVMREYINVRGLNEFLTVSIKKVLE